MATVASRCGSPPVMYAIKPLRPACRSRAKVESIRLCMLGHDFTAGTGFRKAQVCGKDGKSGATEASPGRSFDVSAPLPFTAVLLAGGASRRMGVDKALLPVPEGKSRVRPLWQHQLGTLETLGPVEVLVSGPARPGFPARLRCVPDDVPARGPLGGLAACLAQVTTPWMLVLAVDLPLMTASFLGGLLQACDAGRGVVPRGPDHYEPLAAVYPRA